MKKNPKELYELLFEKYYRPDSLPDWKRKDTFGLNQDQTIKKIQELMDQGYKVKTGYQATSVRGYHERVIFYK